MRRPFVGRGPFFTAGASNWPNWRRHRDPRDYPVREFAEVGGLMSYGTSLTDAWRQVASMPAASSRAPSPRTCRSCRRRKFELVINAQTARMLGLTVPPTLLARADEVIEWRRP